MYVKIAKAPNLLIINDLPGKVVLEASSGGFFYEGDSPSLEEWLFTYSEKKPALFPLSFASYTPFMQKVLLELQKVDFGHTVTYKELAIRAQSPRAARAAGTVCRRNPYPLLVGCHRVLGHNSLGGFAFGLKVKEILLNFEKSN